MQTIEGFIGVCECGFTTDDLPQKFMVRDAMWRHFIDVWGSEDAIPEPWEHGHAWERIG